MTADNVGAGCCLGQQRLKKSKSNVEHNLSCTRFTLVSSFHAIMLMVSIPTSTMILKTIVHNGFGVVLVTTFSSSLPARAPTV
jgi:hypothetical protein